MAELKAFLREVARKPFVWGESDCILTAADWVCEVEGLDPAAKWRGQYDTEDEAEALLTLGGGLVAFVGAALNRQQVPAPHQGDVGVVATRGGCGRIEVTAICTGSRWAAKTPGGLWVGAAEPVAIWRIG